MDVGARVEVVLVAGGRWHDIDFARLRLLAELDRHDVARTTVREDYSDLETLRAADVVVSYTCDVRPTALQGQAMRAWVEGGGRWLALHASCSTVDPPAPEGPRQFSTPRAMAEHADLIGGFFLAHPSIERYTVEVAAPEHPLVEGLGSFDTVDELYVLEMYPPVEVLLHTRFAGECPGFVEGTVPEVPTQPVLWQKRTGAGTTTALTLGHCRGRWDVADLGIADLERQDRVAWDSSGFLEVLSRTVAWAVHGDDWIACPHRHTPSHPAVAGR